MKKVTVVVSACIAAFSLIAFFLLKYTSYPFLLVLFAVFLWNCVMPGGVYDFSRAHYCHSNRVLYSPRL
jgi:hypothetical protein